MAEAKIKSLDTSILMSLANNNSPLLHQRAVKLLSDFETTFFVPSVVLAETANGLQVYFSFDRNSVARFFMLLLRRPNIDIQDVLLMGTLNDFLEYPKLSFNDCLLANEAKLTGRIPLLTFDRALANQLDSAEQP